MKRLLDGSKQQRLDYGTRANESVVTLLWMVVAWLIGTIVFEVAVVGSEPVVRQFEPSWPPSTATPMSERLVAEQTELDLATSSINAFRRIERDSRLRTKLEGIITTEISKLALSKIVHTTPAFPVGIELDTDSVATDPLLSGMPVTEQRFRHAFQQIDQGVATLGMAHRTRLKLAWEQAQESSLPGLVRLTGYTFPPVVVSRIPELPPAIQTKVNAGMERPNESVATRVCRQPPATTPVQIFPDRVVPATASLSAVSGANSRGRVTGLMLPRVQSNPFFVPRPSPAEDLQEQEESQGTSGARTVASAFERPSLTLTWVEQLGGDVSKSNGLGDLSGDAPPVIIGELPEAFRASKNR